jgi:deoxyadenosine/deoxycytidine kinase
MKVVFISGPHGCGKTKLIKELLEDKETFVLNDYDIKFVEELDTIAEMTTFEECLLRLYHRFYTAEQALLKCKENQTDKVCIVDRSIIDSMVYNKVEYDLGTLTEEQYRKLSEISKNAMKIIKPNVIILNPDAKYVVEYLQQRRKTKAREKRDFFCAREDSYEYINNMHKEYERFYDDNNKVLNISSNDKESIKRIYSWINNKK